MGIIKALTIVLLSVFVAVPALAKSAGKSHHTGYSKDVMPGCNSALKWELTSKDCETYLPNIHYADRAMNEQISDMRITNPTTREKRYQIDRLIYPVIGAPNLFFKDLQVGRSNVNDELVVLLSLKDDEYTELLDDASKNASKTKVRKLGFKNFRELDELSGINILLVDRKHRNETEGLAAVNTGTFAFKINPFGIWRYPRTKNMPVGLKERAKLKFVFGQEQMKDVPSGLYDIRLEIINNGRVDAYEYQYNAVRVFDKDEVDPNNYQVLNVTDSQVSVGSKPFVPDDSKGKLAYSDITQEKLRDFTHHLRDIFSGKVNVDQRNESMKRLLNSAFITFNGDLHNGGDPLTMKQNSVASIYNDEANRIINILKELPLPIFLTAGNHDGYTSTGHTPGFLWFAGGRRPLRKLSKKLAKEEVNTQELHKQYVKFLKETKDLPGGRHVDLFNGGYIRVANRQTYNSWLEQKTENKNIMLYDGFNQWKRTYGPLYQSWAVGNNIYVNINTYDLRQHMRTGWGMYTVNYGGNVSPEQMLWISRTIKKRINGQQRQAVLLAHHDPRGGHKNINYPYYFRQVPFKGIFESAYNYVKDEVVLAKICEKAPKSTINGNMNLFLGCMQDGLQEWMRADPQFDCAEEFKNKEDRTCNLEAIKAHATAHVDYSGYHMINTLAANKNLRTFLIGHTHYNSMEIYQKDDELVPESIILDDKSHKKYAAIERVNPARSYTRLFDQQKIAGRTMEKSNDDGTIEIVAEANEGEAIDDAPIVQETLNDLKLIKLMFEKAGHRFHRKLNDHELVVMRFTAISKLTGQKLKSNQKAAFGFQVLTMDKTHNEDSKYTSDYGVVDAALLNDVNFFISRDNGGKNLEGTTSEFAPVGESNIDFKIVRSTRISSQQKDNLVEALFDSSSARPFREGVETVLDGDLLTDK